MTATILTLAVAYGLVAVMLALVLLSTRVPVLIRGGLTLAVAVLVFLTYRGIGELRGLPSDAPPPERFRMLWAQIVEPDKMTGAPGSIFLWLQALDEDNYPTGQPRAHRLPWSEDLATLVRGAQGRVADGEEIAGAVDEAGEDEDTADRLAAEIRQEGGSQQSQRVGERVLSLDFGDIRFETAPAPVTPEKDR